MSETVESTANGDKNGNTENENNEIAPKVNGIKDSQNDSGTAGIDEPDEHNEDDEEGEVNDKDDEEESEKRPSRRSACRPANNDATSPKKTPSKKGGTRGRKPAGAGTGDALKNKLPPYKEIPIELCTKTIVIGKGSDFSCTSRTELTTIPNKEGKFGVGDLIWAKMTGYPWWPCMIAIDPQTGKHSRISGVSYKADHVYHVQYFGVEPSRGWTTIGMILPFEGYDKFAELINDELSKVGDVKNGIKKIHEKYTVKPSLITKWMESVCEAEKALKLDIQTRVKLLTFIYSETVPDKIPKTPKTSKPAKTPKVETPKIENVITSTIKLSDDSVKKTPKSKAGRKPKLVVKNEDVEESKDNIYEFDDDFEAEGQTPTFPTWTSRLPNDEEKRKAIFEHEDNLLLGKRSTFDEDPFDSDDSDEVYVDSNPPSPINTDKDEDKDKDGSSNNNKDGMDSATKDISNSITPAKRRGRKSKKMLEFEAQAKKSLKRSGSTASGNSAKRSKIEKKSKSTKSVDGNDVDDEVDDEKDIPTAAITEVNGGTSNGKIRKWGLVEDSEESGDNASELSASQASGKVKRPVDPICLKCGEDDTPDSKLIICSGPCGGRFHAECVKFVTTTPGTTVCQECDTGIHPCFACGDKENLDTKKCTNKRCSRFYHLHCIAANYPSKVNETSNSFECPLHSCMTCFQNELFFGGSTSAGKQIISCILCPVAYHKNDVCIGAGTVELSRNYAFCPDHYRTTKYKSNEERQNVTYCFSCCKTGSLTCCELCPASFHKDCLEYEVNTDEPFICMSCRHKFPLHYGDIVWSKSGAYRWWPAKIVNPNEIPKVLLNTYRYGEFPVYFFGSHNYAWSSKGRSYLFDEADSQPKGTYNNKKALTATFKRAFAEAHEALLEAKKNKAIALQAMTIKPPRYTSIVTNKYLIPKPAAYEEQNCNCKEKNQNCFDINCLNRATFHECPSTCPLENECKNRRMANRENVKCQPVRSPLHGWGLVAQEPIKKSSFVIEYCGEIIDQAECERRIQQSNKSTYYFLTLDGQSIIDAGPKGNLARFMNHSCEPNCIAEKWTVNGLPRVGLFALRDIEVGEELTFDYQYTLQAGQDNFKCACGTASCRGFFAKGQAASQKRSIEDTGKKAAKRGRKPASVTADSTKKDDNDVHEDVCNKCGDDGKLLLCEQDGCSKSFHLPCVNLERAPRGKWICPAHDENAE